jgi:hypothetical protein
MPKDEKGKVIPLSLEESKRLKGSDAELAEAEKAKAKKEAEDKLKTTETVKAKKRIVRDKKTGRATVAAVETRVAGQEDQGPSAGPKVQLQGPLISTGKKLARTGARAPKRGELARGITIVDQGPKRKKKKPTNKVVRDAKTGRIVQLPFRKKTADEVTRTELPTVEAPAAPKPRTLAPGAGARREAVYVDTTKPKGNQASRKLKGLAVPHKMIAPAVGQALEHLRGMAATKGTPEYHQHVEAFNAIHPTILGMDPTIHHALGAMAHHTMYPKHDSHSVITQITSAIGDRLSEGRSMEVQRAKRQGRN